MEKFQQEELFRRLKELDSQNKALVFLLQQQRNWLEDRLASVLKAVRNCRSDFTRRDKKLTADLQKAIAAIVSPEIDPRVVKDFMFHKYKKK